MSRNQLNQFSRNRNLFFIRSESYYQKDKRILSNHKVYHIGRFFALIGSGIFAFGLLCKFIFSEEAESETPVVTISVASIGVVILSVGVVCVFTAVYKAQMAIFRHEKNQSNRSSGADQNPSAEISIISTPHLSYGTDSRDNNISINRTVDFVD